VTDCLDGTEPTQLIALPDGTFYGASRVGGAYGGGTIFRMSASGKVTVLYSFCSQANCADGSHPNALTLASDGNLYGTTTDGGTSKAHCVYGCGTIFKFDPGRGLTTIYNDCALVGCVDISYVYTGLIQGSDGNLYGTSAAGGGNKNGTAFQITPSGKLTILHSFSSADYQVDGPFIQHTNGYLYAVDPWTGTYSDGMIFDISMNLNPFASLLRPWGKVGQATRILGQGFLGTSSVSFNGTPAAFATHSDTVLSVIVPAGATTGPVSVITSTGTLTSNRNFQVLPQVLTFDPPSGPVGTVVTINGVSLTQAQAVAFGNRISSTFTVNSDTQITATVPASAKTGAIWIRTVGGAATSPATFTVTP
jgi:uncharacterized repeat protein (TIGR03803 family)